MERFFNLYLGLVGLGIVMYFTFSDPRKTINIINGASNVGADFVGTLEGR